jgi:hypothetical protein
MAEVLHPPRRLSLVARAQEKLCPILAMYKAPTYVHAVHVAHELIMYGGAGHTSVLYTNPLNKAHIELFESTVKTVRILINTPASQGAIGDLYNFHLDPSLTLGCGTWGSTSVSNNVGPQHLLNIKTVTSRRENMLWFRVPPKVRHCAAQTTLFGRTADGSECGWWHFGRVVQRRTWEPPEHLDEPLPIIARPFQPPQRCRATTD